MTFGIKPDVESILHFGIPTFMHAEYVLPKKAELKKAKADIAILGAPFELGTGTGIPGASLGPRAIRLGSEQIIGYNIEFDTDFSKSLKVVDCGDVPPVVGHGGVPTTLDRIRETVSEILSSGVLPIVLGGDHTIPVAISKALHDNIKGKMGIIHFDSHMDTWDTISGTKINNGTFIIRATELERCSGKNIAQIGMSGYLNARHCRTRAEKLGIRTFYRKEVFERGIKDVTKEAVEIAKKGTEAVYMTIDIDVLDASCAPATSVPAIAGLTTRELIEAVRIVANAGVDTCDICEVGNPAADPNNITGTAAASIIAEFITATLLGRRGH